MSEPDRSEARLVAAAQVALAYSKLQGAFEQLKDAGRAIWLDGGIREGMQPMLLENSLYAIEAVVAAQTGYDMAEDHLRRVVERERQ